MIKICYSLFTTLLYLEVNFFNVTFLLCGDFNTTAEIVSLFSLCCLRFRYCTRHGELRNEYDISLFNTFTATLGQGKMKLIKILFSRDYNVWSNMMHKALLYALQIHNFSSLLQTYIEVIILYFPEEEKKNNSIYWLNTKC